MSSNDNSFDSFNARYLDFNQIAKTFIPNDQYWELQKNNHSLIMGPRGSGKTTLLKMLTPPGIYYLRQINPEFDVPPFYSVYIPTDIHWKKQLDHFYTQNFVDENDREIISRFLVTTNILICLCNTFRYLIEFQFKGNHPEDNRLALEANLSKLLIEDWDIDAPISPNLLSIERTLKNRISKCNKLILKLKYGHVVKTGQNYIPDYYYNDYYSLLSSSCSSFERIFCDSEEQKWALCFDELEISPEWLQFELIDKLRSVDQKFLFKLTTSPIVSMVNRIEEHKIEAREDEDYRVIRTWNYNDSCTTKWNEFSEKLTAAKIKRAFPTINSPIEIFSKSSYSANLKLTFEVDGIDEFKTKYEKGAIYWKLFKELAIIDPSFKKFLTFKNINYLDPSPKNVAEKDAIFRKILPVAVYRYQFLNIHGRRSRKNSSLYYGVPLIYEICDGNPRFLMNLLDQFLTELKLSNKGTIDISRQSTIFKSISKKYLELIKAHPDSNIELFPNRLINLGDIISRIGTYFNDRLINEEFTMDPVGAFIIDPKVPLSIINLIELGVHLGAIIYLEPDQAISAKGLRGKILRLSYLLNPNFELPKREYKGVSLSKILYRGNTRQIDSQLIFEL